MLSAELIREGQASGIFDLPTLRLRGKTPESIRAQQWRCKFCHHEMTPKMGPVRTWHFGHAPDATDCPFERESEPESPHHQLLKRTSAEALARHFAAQTPQVEYEVRLPQAGRIADALLTLADGSRVAVEAQLSPITLEELMVRTRAYHQAEIEVVWVFLEERLKAGGLWAELRRWLLEEGCLVLSARSEVVTKTLNLGTSLDTP